MNRLSRIFIYVFAALFCIAGWLAVTFGMLSVKQKKTIEFQQTQITGLNENLKRALEKTAISFQISPEIQNKVTSAFGSTKNVTLQYYFTLDGKAMIAKPDSIYHITKEY